MSGVGKAHADPLYIGFDPGPGATGQIYSSPVSFGGTGSAFSVSYVHNDQDSWKGMATIMVTNSGTQSWGDFHFQVFSLYPQSGWSNPADVFFGATGQYAPTYSHSMSGPTLALDSVTVTPSTAATGATLDLVFNSNPVAAGQTAVFTVYTDNTTDQKLFGLSFYPSLAAPVPIPGALLLFGPALAGIGVIRKRLKK